MVCFCVVPVVLIKILFKFLKSVNSFRSYVVSNVCIVSTIKPSLRCPQFRHILYNLRTHFCHNLVNNQVTELKFGMLVP